MFIDKINIKIKSGDGGDGFISFHTEKFVPNGGPDGGDGGRGGDIVFVADGSCSSLVDFYYKKTFRAEDGKKGDTNNSSGKSGRNLIIRVPAGTVIKDAESEKIIEDMFSDTDKRVVLKGGKGGKGNAKFANSRRQSPHFAQKGEKTLFRTISLELKTIADVGLVGFPNVGKSTLLGAVSEAKPKIGNYHFTTLSPNLGVVRYYDGSFVAADIPGLIEGAASGAGLGFNFLRHIERTRFLLHVVDISGAEGRDPYEDFVKLNAELSSYSAVLAKLPMAVAANKCETAEAEQNLVRFKKKVKNVEVFAISALQRKGLSELLKYLTAELMKLPKARRLEYEQFNYPEADIDGVKIEKIADDVFAVAGGFIDNLLRRINFSDSDSFIYFQKLLKDREIFKQLRELGAKEGDTVVVGDMEFDFVD